MTARSRSAPWSIRERAPVETAALDRLHVKGFATDVGGRTSHRLAQVPIPQGKPSCLLPAPLGVTGVSLDRVHQRLYFAAEQEELADIGWMRELTVGKMMRRDLRTAAAAGPAGPPPPA